MSHVQPRESFYPGNERVRAEIQRYMRAVASYPARFARDPEITFRQHLFSRVARNSALRRDSSAG